MQRRALYDLHQPRQPTNCSVYVKYILISPVTKYFKHEFRALFPPKTHDHALYRRTNTTWLCLSASKTDATSFTALLKIKDCEVDYINRSPLQSLSVAMPTGIITAWRYSFQPFYTLQLSYCYYAALLPRRGPHIASHSVCPSVRPSRYRYRASRRAT